MAPLSCRYGHDHSLILLTTGFQVLLLPMRSTESIIAITLLYIIHYLIITAGIDEKSILIFDKGQFNDLFFNAGYRCCFLCISDQQLSLKQINHSAFFVSFLAASRRTWVISSSVCVCKFCHIIICSNSKPNQR